MATEVVQTEPSTPTDGIDAAQTTAGQDGTLLGGQAEAVEQVTADATTGAPADAKATETAPKAPEAYALKAFGEDFGDAGKAYTEVARELDLTNESAQKIVDTLTPAIERRFEQAAIAQSAAWAEQAKSDKEFGGAKLSENLGVATKAAQEFGGDELMQVLRETGLGNHPAVIRAFLKVGKKVGGDGFVGGTSAPTKEKSLAERLYPSLS